MEQTSTPPEAFARLEALLEKQKAMNYRLLEGYEELIRLLQTPGNTTKVAINDIINRTLASVENV